MKDDTTKIEQMIINNFSNQQMKQLIDQIISCKDKEKLKASVLNGALLQKFKSQTGTGVSSEEEEIIKTIYLYLCLEGNAEKMKKMMENNIKLKIGTYTTGSEKLTFLQWKDKKKQDPKIFE